MQEFGTGDGIVEDFDALNPSIQTYRPKNLPEREEQLFQIHNVLRPIENGNTPHNAFVFGPTGQGKTVAVQLKTEQLEQWADQEDLDLEVVHVTCKGCGNSYHVLTQLVRDLREVRKGPGEDKPKGYQQKELFEMVVDELEKIGGYVVLVLDEVDGIGNDDYVLYELSRASLENCRLGIIGITNDMQFRDSLDADVRSSIGERKIEFGAYQADQLRNILSRRAVRGLRDTDFDGDPCFENLRSDVIRDGAIARAAAISAQETGDARQGIRLLQLSCDFAHDDGVEVVTDEHVRRAHEHIQKSLVSETIKSETIQRKMALLTVVWAENNESVEMPAETTALYSTYRKMTEEQDVSTLAELTFRNKLNDLVNSNILTKERHGRGRGKGMTNKYGLSVGLEVVTESLEDADDQRARSIAEGL